MHVVCKNGNFQGYLDTMSICTFERALYSPTDHLMSQREIGNPSCKEKISYSSIVILISSLQMVLQWAFHV